MAASDQMAGYAAHLNAKTPVSSKGKPVTEIAIFTLQPPYDQDHAATASRFESQIVQNCRPGAPYARGVRRIAWGFSLNDPKTFVWLLDWDKIEDHWDFWLTPGFPPVMESIAELFTPGRPLVRHYDFGEQGMLDPTFEVVRIIVGDDGVKKDQWLQSDKLEGDVISKSNCREAYAVDLDESTWWARLLGHGSEEEALELTGESAPGDVSHVFFLNHVTRT